RAIPARDVSILSEQDINLLPLDSPLPFPGPAGMLVDEGQRPVHSAFQRRFDSFSVLEGGTSEHGRNIFRNTERTIIGRTAFGLAGVLGQLLACRRVVAVEHPLDDLPVDGTRQTEATCGVVLEPLARGLSAFVPVIDSCSLREVTAALGR